MKNSYVLLLITCALLNSSGVQAKMTKEAHALYQEACSYEYKNARYLIFGKLKELSRN